MKRTSTALSLLAVIATASALCLLPSLAQSAETSSATALSSSASASQQVDNAAAVSSLGGEAGSGPMVSPAGSLSSEGPMAETAVAPQANPYGLAALWGQGDLVAKITLLILALMSMGSWYILFIKLWEQRGLFAQGRAARKRLEQAATLDEAIANLSKNSSFRHVAEEGVAAAAQHGRGLGAQVSLLDWTSMALARAIDGVAGNLQGGLAFLATVGSTAPFVGLFGTVWGIYHALIAIGLAGQASIDKVAGPVGEALIMTAIGLAVAVPAVLGYNWLVRRNKAALDQVRRFATEVEARLLVKAA
ncbi:MAG TPA: MotA/TolQ/ExbB proton channel family protein [Parvibaculum sp.]